MRRKSFVSFINKVVYIRFSENIVRGFYFILDGLNLLWFIENVKYQYAERHFLEDES